MREARESYSRHGMRERLEQPQGSTAVHFFDGTERVLGRSVPTANKQSCDVGGGGGSQHPSGPENSKDPWEMARLAHCRARLHRLSGAHATDVEKPQDPYFHS